MSRFDCIFYYTATPLYRGAIDRGNRYNADVLCRPFKKKKRSDPENFQLGI